MPKEKPPLPPYEPKDKCERCGKKPAADFGTEILCNNCVAKDVFEEYSKEENY